MRIFIFSFKLLLLFLLWMVLVSKLNGQTDTSLFKRVKQDSSVIMNMDVVYNRPFLSAGKLPIAIGGYFEANSNYASTNGITEGLSFQARRFTLFFSSSIAKRIRLLSELEFEDGTKEINLEFAAMDVEFHPLLTFRGGILMNPIGAFNQNHDGPRWDFIDRPLSATTIIPSTLSNVGFGFYGKYFSRPWIFAYEVYLTNGFDDKIINNESNRTSLAAGKVNIDKFEESNSGSPMFTGKIAIRNRKFGELGISYMSGIFNKFQEDGIILDTRRKAEVMAIDFNISLIKNRLTIMGEYARVFVNVPLTYFQTYASKQSGFYCDIIGTIFYGKFLDWEKSKLNLVIRTDYVDYNQDKFRETGGKIGDEKFTIVPGIAFRPTGTTVFRFNYRIEREWDILRNPAIKTGVIQLGFSTYF